MIGLAKRLSRADPERVRKALLEAMAVEANFRNVGYGHLDSEGVLQQRPSQGWGAAGETAAQDIMQFLTRARRTNRNFQGTAGQLAQAIQRSAFPERYDQRRSEVEALLGQMQGSPVAMPQRATSPVDSNYKLKLFLALQKAKGQGPMAIVNAFQGFPKPATQAPSPSPQRQAMPLQAGGGMFSPEELFHDPLGGYKHGQWTGAIGGHGSHLHVAEDDPAQMLRIIQLAKKLGLHVGENPWTTGRVVRSGHAPLSYHKRETPFRGRLMGRASDISGNPAAMKKLFLALSRGFKRRRK